MLTQTKPAPQLFHPRGLRLLQVAWWGLLLIVLLAYTVFLPARWHHLTTIVHSQPHDMQLLGRQAVLLAHFNISPIGYAGLVLSMELFFTLAFATVAILIFWRRHTDPMAVLVAYTMLNTGCASTSYLSALGKAIPAFYWSVELLQAQSLYLMLLVSYTFPDGRFVPRWTRWAAMLYALLYGFWVWNPGVLFNFISGFAQPAFVSIGFGMLTYATAAYALFYRFRRVAEPLQRQQIKWAVYGMMVALAAAQVRYPLPYALDVFGFFSEHAIEELFGLAIRPIFGIALTIIPFCFAIATLRYRLWDIDPLIRRTALYSLLTLALIASVFVSGFILQVVLRPFATFPPEIAVLISTAIGIALFGPIRARLQQALRNIFDRTQVDFRRDYLSFARQIRSIFELEALLAFIPRKINELFRVEYMVIFLCEPTKGLLPAAQYQLPERLLQMVPKEEALVRLAQGEGLQWASAAPFVLLLPLLAIENEQTELIGVLALGPRLSEQPYSAEDYALLMSLADQTSAGIVAARMATAQQQLTLYRASPAGRAEALAQQLAQQSDTALNELQQLAYRAASDTDALRLLAALPSALQAQNASILAGVAEGYRYLCEGQEDPAMLQLALRTLVGWHELALAEHPQPQTEHVMQCYRLCLTAFTVTDFQHFHQLGAVLLAANRQQGDTSSTLDTALHTLLRPVQAVIRSQNVAPGEAIVALSEAFEQLYQFGDIVNPTLVKPERGLFQAIIMRWQGIIETELTILRGSPWFELRLVTRQVIYASEITIVVELANSGPGQAGTILLELMPIDDCTITRGRIPIDRLEPYETHTLSFAIHPRHTTQLPLRFKLSYFHSNQRNSGGTQTIRDFAYTLQLIEERPWHGPIKNPYIAGMPLASDSPVFFGRDDDLAAVSDMLHEQQNALLITGQRRMGKTSLLKRLPNYLGDRFVCAFLDAQGLSLEPGTWRFFADLTRALTQALQASMITMPPESHAPEQVFTTQVLPMLQQAAASRTLVVLLDEFEELEARIRRGAFERTLLPYLRHLMQHDRRIHFVFSGTQRLDELDQHYWGGLFNATLHRRIGPLNHEAAHQLITAPVANHLHYDDLALHNLVYLSGGHPFFLQSLCQVLVRAANREQRTVILSPHVASSISAVLDQAEAHLTSLWIESSSLEQAFLLALAEQHQGLPFMTPAQLLERVSEKNLTLEEVGRIAQKLQQRALIRGGIRQGTHESLYGWKLGIFREWIVQTQNVRRSG
jgi:hypothetical protein